jgi:hypothetical protein
MVRPVAMQHWSAINRRGAIMFQRRISLAAVLSSFAALALAQPAPAQTPTPPRQPAYSPYLNLTRPGSVANNYYGLVRPDIDFRNSLNNLQQQYTGLNQAINNPTAVDSPFPGTGHKTSFMNYSHFYSIRGRTAGGTNAPGAGAAPPAYRR